MSQDYGIPERLPGRWEGGYWRSSYGILLDEVCECGVSVGRELIGGKRGRVEFDGMPHRCVTRSTSATKPLR